MKIRGVEVPVNIEEELEPYMGQLRDSRIRGNKLQACSPFRYERHPSFAVNLDDGTWIDSGSPSDEYYKGSFITLLAYFRQEEWELAEDYLLKKYNVMLADVDKLNLAIELVNNNTSSNTTYNWKELTHLHFRHPYLARRGISEAVQKLFLIGFDKELDAIAMPWIDVDKNIINIKYRNTKNKHFYYEQDGQLTRNYVYGLAQCYHLGHKSIAMVESEIDAMSFWTIGVPAVAMGHAGLSVPQLLKLIKAGIEEITIASDNDEAGHRFRATLRKMLPKHFKVNEMEIGYGAKDVNDLLLLGKLEECYNNRKTMEIKLMLS